MNVDRKPKAADVAARAGVSLATVDRVLNSRGGVAPHTVARVEDALRTITPSSRASRIEDVSPCSVLLANDGSAFIRLLSAELKTALSNASMSAEVSYVDRQSPASLVAGIASSVAQGARSLILQAVDTIEVRTAIDEAAAAGVTIVTVTTDVPNSRRHGYVGLDNRAAGRTAGYLMGRFCHGAGTLAIVWGGQTYRSHEERESGFRSVLRSEHPDLKCLEVFTGDYTVTLARQLTASIITQNEDLLGIYCVGGGIAGVADAVMTCKRSTKPILIGHNYNSDTLPYLLSGIIAALVHQDVPRIAADVLAALLDQAPNGTRKPIRAEIITRENIA